MVTKNLRDATVFLEDGAGRSLLLALEEGDWTFTEHDEAFVVLDRGKIAHARKSDEQPVEGSFTLKFREFLAQGGADDATPYEALTRSGAASGWESTNEDGGGVYTLDVTLLLHTPTEGEQNEAVGLKKLHAQSVEFSEGDEYDTLSFDFMAVRTDADVGKTACEASCTASCQTACQTGCETAVET